MFSIALLCGGKSGRMGQDKALMSFLGRPLILRMLERLASITDEVIISTNRPEDYKFLDLPLYPDILPNNGALGGLYSSFRAAHNPIIAAVACDMPFASPSLFAYEYEQLCRSSADVVIPSSQQGLEPLHAVYRRETCLPIIQSALKAGLFKLIGWLSQVDVKIVPPEEFLPFDELNLAFSNLNTPEEFQEAEEKARLIEN
jgi:molybdopterin-guanine dinucleotide biosynthesis protein A